MPSAATITATIASASKTLNTRASASAIAPWMRSIGFASRANVAGDCASASGAAIAAAPGAKRTAKASAPRTPSVSVASFQPTRIASPLVPGMERSTIAGDASARAGARSRPGCAYVSPTCEPEASARPCRQDRRATGVERGERRRPIAGHEGQPPVGEEVGTDDRGGVDAHAAEREVERGNPGHPGHAGHRRERLERGLVLAPRAGSSSRARRPAPRPRARRSAESRAAWADQPRATIIARPITSEPRVSVVRLRSRASEPRASRSSIRRIRRDRQRRAGGPAGAGRTARATWRASRTA